MTARRQRRSTQPLSFIASSSRCSVAAIVPAKPLSESAQHAAIHPPNRFADPEPSETIGKTAPDTDPTGQAASTNRSLGGAPPGGLRTDGALALRDVLHELAHLAEALVRDKGWGLPFLKRSLPRRQYLVMSVRPQRRCV